jgi:HPt (histidine-containing phosphotransfer) domain-containing protein
MAGESERARIDLALLDPDGTFPARLAGDSDALAGYARDLWSLEAEARQERLKQIATLAHRLAGAAGTFGYHGVSAAALALERQILDRQPGEDLALWQAPVQQAMDALARALEDGLARAKR